MKRTGTKFKIVICSTICALGIETGIQTRAQLKFQIPNQAFTDSAFWKESVFTEEFSPKEAPTSIALKEWSERADVFDAPTHGIWARFVDEKMESLTVLFLDSGTHFGYVPKSSAAETKLQHRQRFKELFTKTGNRVEEGLDGLSNGIDPIKVTLGSSPMLTQTVSIYKTGNLFARYHRIPEQLLKVTWFRTLEEAKTWSDVPDKNDPKPALQTTAIVSENGDVILQDVPILPQGDRAYCGVSALAMTMQHLGLNAETEDYAAAAGIRYGSTKGSFIREVYDGAADEAGFRLQIHPTITAAQVEKSIKAGIPVIVWRRWNQQRDFLHSTFSRKLVDNPEINLPEPDADDQQTWPRDRNFNHASVITGFNTVRGEVIFSESWNESVRNRRMRIEEMNGTTYGAFLFEPIQRPAPSQ